MTPAPRRSTLRHALLSRDHDTWSPAAYGLYTRTTSTGAQAARRGGAGRARMYTAALASSACALVAAAPPAVAGGPSGGQVRQALAAWTSAHPQTGALVWRLSHTSPEPVLAFRANTPRLPASTMKLVTSAGALLGLGPDFRFETRLFAGVNAVRRGATLTGPLYLVGSGDPLLATPAYARRYLGSVRTSITGLIRPLRADGLRLLRGPVIADERVFDTRRTGPRWKASYVGESPPLSGLSVNQNYAGDRRGAYVRSPATAAARRLGAVMEAMGVRRRGVQRGGRAPQRARLLSTVRSPALRRIVALMNATSDNFVAESLLKAVGARMTGTGSTGAGTQQTARLLSERGILDPADRLVDGSGLSRANRLTAASLVRLLAAADADSQWGRALVTSMARGGEGTLRRRFRGSSVAKRVRAKTGYLNGVSTLAGIVRSRSGTRYAFAFLMNDWDISGARATQDRIVTLLAAGAGDGLPSLATG